MKNPYASSKNISHACIIESPDETKRDKLALELACTFVCSDREHAPCMRCHQCKVASQGFHPDVIVIERPCDDKGKKKQFVQVEQVRHMVADAWVRPQQAERKVYIIRDASYMNTQAQNAALKLLEEPPDYAAFILCAHSAEALLSTIRSRCVVYRPGDERIREKNPMADEFVAIAARGNNADICAFCVGCESLEGELLTQLIEDIRLNLCDVLCMRGKDFGLSRENAARILALCDRAAEYLRMNVGAKHVLGLLSALTI